MAAVSIIDYGVGNIRAFAQVYRRLNIAVALADTPQAVAAAERLILPGVGAFDWTMDRLDASGLRGALDTAVMDRKVPVLGVCVGMQMMAKRSDEGRVAGLGWIDADVRHFAAIGADPEQPLPHMGWNDVHPAHGQPSLFAGIADPRYYFLHSYCVVANNPDDIAATAHYGIDFAAAIRRNNIYATQFHPEKSHDWGVALLRNFAAI
jgi:imidazole glycerol-phosphate synthase subunit HisH